MDKKALANYLYAIYAECNKKMSIFVSKYKEITKYRLDNGFELRSASWDSSMEASKAEIVAYDKIKALENDIRNFLKKITGKISRKIPASSYPKLRIILDKENSVEPILSLDEGLQYGTHQPTIALINKLNSIVFNLEATIGELDNSEASYIINRIEYSSENQAIKINDKSISIGRGERIDLMLRAFFGNKCRNLLRTTICDGDIYLLAEDDGLLIGKSKAEKRKYILDGYKLLNNKTRAVIPDNKDLVVRIGNGFILNPDLKYKPL